MFKRLRVLTVGFLGLGLVSSAGCTHKDDQDKGERSEVSVTDESKSQPSDTTTASPSTSAVRDSTSRPARVEKPVKRTEAAAKRTRAAVSAGAPAEGSDAEYAADVDAAMGDTNAEPVSEANADADVDVAARGTTAVAADNDSVSVNSAEADNSRVNRVNDGDVGVTADQQGNSRADIEITRKIRKSITDNKKLSIYAHNVKIITRDGRVVLKGPVRSEAERNTIEMVAAKVAGAANVTSGIQVQPK